MSSLFALWLVTATTNPGSPPATVVAPNLRYSVTLTTDGGAASEPVGAAFAKLLHGVVDADPRTLAIAAPPADTPAERRPMFAPQLILYHRLLTPTTNPDGSCSIRVEVEFREPSDNRPVASAIVTGSSGRVASPTVRYFEWNGDRKVGEALIAAAGAVRGRLDEVLRQHPWTATVVMNKHRRVYINRGRRDGVTKGLTLGTDAGASSCAHARIEVTEVMPTMAICRLVDGSIDLQPGDRFTPFTAASSPSPSPSPTP